IEDAILGNYLLGKPNKKLPPKEKAKVIQQLKEITLWGVPLLPSKRHEGTDIVLLKFLKARDFKVHDAFKMLRKTLIWRKEYMADEILEEKLDPDLEKVVYLCGTDRKGHPLCYSVFGVLKDKELYEKIFKTHEDSEKFLRRKIQCMEKGVKLLNFRVGGANSIVQITDLKNSPAPEMKELRSCVKKSMMLLQDHYPELIHKNIIINTSLWYYTCHVLTSRLINQTSTNKFVFARPSRVTETLLKYMAPENLPVEYGGLRRENDDDFSPQDHVRELNVRGNTAGCIPIPVTEPGITMVWDLTVVGWEVSYQEEFIPEDEGSYEVMLHNKEDKKGGESIRNSFYISEPGKIVITIDNTTLKKKKVFYRYKTKPTVPMYIFSKQ
ncbi:CRAL_TRIO domain-containing protein/CRAL_TRIO_N domain-containing protein, partial [Cephalotus follicularis]